MKIEVPARLSKQREIEIYTKSWLSLILSGKSFVYELLSEIYFLREEVWALSLQLEHEKSKVAYAKAKETTFTV